MDAEKLRPVLKEILPKTGLAYSEKGALTEILCKPKIIPIKSAVLEQLAKIEGERDQDQDQDQDTKYN
jgi:BBSome-interacting protein 1